MMVVSFSMAYRSFRGGSGRLDTHLDTPPSINRRHPDSCLARLSGANLVSASFVNARPARAEMEFCFDGKRILRGTYLRLAKLDSVDLSGANLDGADGMTQAKLDVAHCNTGTNSSRP